MGFVVMVPATTATAGNDTSGTDHRCRSCCSLAAESATDCTATGSSYSDSWNWSTDSGGVVIARIGVIKQIRPVSPGFTGKRTCPGIG